MALDVGGNALVDVPLADCKITLDSNVESLEFAGNIQFEIKDSRWTVGAFANARLNALQVDDDGIAALPPRENPGWFDPDGPAGYAFSDGLDMIIGS